MFTLTIRLLRAALLLPLASVVTFGGTILPIVDLQGGNLKVNEKGGLNEWTQIFPTSGGSLISNGNGGFKVQQHALSDPVPGHPNQGQYTFLLPPSYTVGGHKSNVTDYQQVTGDPGTLSASVFLNGIMVDSLSDWLDANGFTGDNQIDQPDFLPLAGQPALYYGVNLADLTTMGMSFVNSHSFGDVFTIDANGKLPELPTYVFSSTPLAYVPGAGWEGTPLNPGTQVVYGAFHATSTVPEPASLLLMGAGLMVLGWRRTAAVKRNAVKAKLNPGKT